MLQEPGRALNLASANGQGQQLFLANMQFKRHRSRRLEPEHRGVGGPPKRNFAPCRWRQLALFDLEPDADLVQARALKADTGC